MIRHRRPLHSVSGVLSAAFCLLVSACLLPTAFGQGATATLSGTVVDANGAVVPGASVRLINSATGLQRETTTNDSGDFTAPLLHPSTYTLRVERQGFAPAEIQDLVLNVGDQKSLQIQLKAGSITEMVKVEGGASLINESPAVGTVIDRQFVGNLPLNGRSFQSLILLTPGVTVTNGIDGGGQFSVNGQRANTNYFTIDGVSGNVGVGVFTIQSTVSAQSGSLPGLTSFGGTNNLISVDALEEFRIQTSTYSAEFGRQPGGQISLVSRSGTNDFHGTLFEYFRNEALDARNYFNRKPAPQTPLRQNQFGGTFSGPVMLPRFGEGGKTYWSGLNRTFFFFSYEGLRLRLPQNGIANVPSLRLRQVAAPAVQPLLNATPVPTGPELVNAAGQPLGRAPYNFGISNPTTSDATGIRIDHRIRANLTLFGRYNEAPSNTVTRTATFLTTPTDTAASTRTVTLASTWAISPMLSNELRFNYSRHVGRLSAFFDPVGGAFPIDLTALTSGYNGGGLRTGSVNFTPAQSGLSLGDASVSSQRQINIVDNVSLVKGDHQLRFGADYRRLAPVFAARDYGQNFRFSNETAIRNGIVSSLSISASDRTLPLFDNFSVYAHDSWKVTSRVTLDLGLRWELNPPPREASGRRPVTVVGVDNLPTATLAPPDAPVYKTFYTALAPRFGVAYQPNRTSGRETVLRGGFGVYYDLGSGQATSGFLFGPPFFASISRANVAYPIPPALAQPPAFPTVTLPTNLSVYSIDSNLKLPYTFEWNVAVEQSLGKQQSISLSYVASAGRRLLLTQLLNVSFTGTPPNPNFLGGINFTRNGATSDYHSFQAQFQRRLSRGLQALVNYTGSHAIDEVR